MKANVLALLAAFAFAFGNVLQQKGTLEAPAEEDDPRFLAQILRRPVWLAGAACQGGGWVLQAVALDSGSLIVVQSLTTMSLVIALPLGKRFTGQQVNRRVWIGAAAIVVGIVLFLSVGSPTGGTSTPPASAWWSAGLVGDRPRRDSGRLGRHRQGAPRALFFGSAAGVAFAMQSAVTKVFVTVVGQGLSAVLSSWTIYVAHRHRTGRLRSPAVRPQNRRARTGDGVEQCRHTVRERGLWRSRLRGKPLLGRCPTRPRP